MRRSVHPIPGCVGLVYYQEAVCVCEREYSAHMYMLMIWYTDASGILTGIWVHVEGITCM